MSDPSLIRDDAIIEAVEDYLLSIETAERIANAVLAAVTPMIEAAALKEASEALMDQWLSNHAEHCGVRGPPWPHEGMCHWPMPEILTRLQALKP